MQRIDYLAAVLAFLLLVLCSAPVIAMFTDDEAAAECTTDSECSALCRPDDPDCDGGPAR